jgi:hypothetical protein
VNVDPRTLADRLRSMVRDPDAVGTHSDECWQWHDDCALLLAADRLAALLDAIGDAVRSIRGDHYEDPSIRTLCVLCGAADGSYPCTALMEADALAAAVQPPDPKGTK